MNEHDETFSCMGCEVRLLIGNAQAGAREAAGEARAWLDDFDARLSRFRADSELSRLNRDERPVVHGSRLLAALVAAGYWAAERSGGLVDPTLLGAIEASGYRRSGFREGRLLLARALGSAPARRPARPASVRRWRAIRADLRTGAIVRPPGLRIDSGGVGKGLAADAVSHRLTGCARYAIDCGGDIRVGGHDAARRPYEVGVEHPLTGEAMGAIPVRRGGVATSGLDSRIWSAGGAGFGHHLLDPSTGRPAWTGLVSATALGPTALEAETLAKAALLSGPAGASRFLTAYGGLVVHDDGDVEPVGDLRLANRGQAPLAA